jgi:hypothetical protein
LCTFVKLYYYFKSWGPHVGSHECYHPLGYSAVWSVCEPTFRKNVSPPYSGSKINRAVDYLYSLILKKYLSITVLDIIHCPFFYLKCIVSETGFCLRIQVEATQTDPIERASLCFRTPTTTPIEFTKPTQQSPLVFLLVSWDTRFALSIGPIWVGSTWRRRQNSVSKSPCFK